MRLESRNGWLAILMFAIACANSGTDEQGTDVQGTEEQGADQEWYSGGDLHDKTVSAWLSASYANRLATSADFVMSVGDYQEIPQDLRSRSEEMEECITEATSDGTVDHQAVSGIGATCAVLLGY